MLCIQSKVGTVFWASLFPHMVATTIGAGPALAEMELHFVKPSREVETSRIQLSSEVLFHQIDLRDWHKTGSTWINYQKVFFLGNSSGFGHQL